MIHCSALCVYMNMCSVLWTTTTECIQLVATQALDVLTAYHKSSCILSCRAFLAAYACAVLTPCELWARICVSLNLFFFPVLSVVCLEIKGREPIFCVIVVGLCQDIVILYRLLRVCKERYRMCRKVKEVYQREVMGHECMYFWVRPNAFHRLTSLP